MADVDEFGHRRRLKRQMRSENHRQSVSVSNATNSKLPDDLKSRIFIGNLNTSIINKRHLHLLFAQFGDIKAISMHKGYAFVQFSDEFDALNAVFAQDGQLLAGQAMDVNLVTEPKPHQRARKKKTSACSSESEENGFNAAILIDNDFTRLNNGIRVNQIGEVSQIVYQRSVGNDCSEDIGQSSAVLQNTMDIEQNGEKEIDQLNDLNAQSKRAKIECQLDDENFQQLTNCAEVSDQDKSQEIVAGDSNDLCEDLKVFYSESFDTRSSSASSPTTTAMTSSSSTFGSSCGPTRSELPSTGTCTKRLRLEPKPIPSAINQPPPDDILICGNCRSLFTSLNVFIRHKRTSKCRLRFVCHCHQVQ